MDREAFLAYVEEKRDEAGVNRIPIFVDVDNTLIFWKGGTGAFAGYNDKLIDFLRKAHATDGIEIILWSANGADHCRNASKDTGIEDIVSLYLTKPAVMIDDLETDAFSVRFDPNQEFPQL